MKGNVEGGTTEGLNSRLQSFWLSLEPVTLMFGNVKFSAVTCTPLNEWKRH